MFMTNRALRPKRETIVSDSNHTLSDRFDLKMIYSETQTKSLSPSQTNSGMVIKKLVPKLLSPLNPTTEEFTIKRK